MAFGMPTAAPLIQPEKPPGTEPPAVGSTYSAMPSKIDQVASVTMNGCSRSLPTSTPLIIPAAAPMARITTLHSSVVAVPVKCVAAIVVPRASTPPTDRSMPAVTMTTPWPRPITANARVSAARMPRLPVDSVPGCRPA